MDRNKALKVLLSVAEGASYDSEYDGINDTYCCYCDANLSRHDHEEDCLMFIAREAIADEWAELQEKQKLENEAAHKKSWGYQIEKIACPNCRKKVKRVGLTRHIKDSGCDAQL